MAGSRLHSLLVVGTLSTALAVAGCSPAPRAGQQPVPASGQRVAPSHAAPSTGERRTGGLAGRIVFSTEDDIYSVRADGSDLCRLTTRPGPEFDGAWSPDGSRIVYRDSRRGINNDDEIYVMNADGSGQRDLTRDPADDWGPAWAPDGSKIALNSDRDSPGKPVMKMPLRPTRPPPV
jgi:dipeptidyl aminopeptidase/acylaminoacyl peptidase